MKTFPFLMLFLVFMLYGCDKVAEDLSGQYSAQIVGFDLNCSTCIVSFPDDSLKIKELFGASPDNYYEIINLDKGDFKIGDKLRVKVRKAENAELKACITLYPSYNYKDLYVSDYVEYSKLILNDTIELSYKDCFNDSDRQSFICLDTVLTDSRCPSDVICVWAGEARARFKIEKYNSSLIFIDLYEGVKDTLIDGYKISFIKLLPYPISEHQTRPEEYKARLVIKRN